MGSTHSPATKPAQIIKEWTTCLWSCNDSMTCAAATEAVRGQPQYSCGSTHVAPKHHALTYCRNDGQHALWSCIERSATEHAQAAMGVLNARVRQQLFTHNQRAGVWDRKLQQKEVVPLKELGQVRDTGKQHRKTTQTKLQGPLLQGLLTTRGMRNPP